MPRGRRWVRGSKPLLHAERLLLSLFVECLSEATPVPSEIAENVSQAQVRMAEEWIDAHLGDAIGVDEVATAIGVGIRSLQISFRRVRGCTPHEFITRRRLEVAQQLLLTAGQEATVTAIALQLGFFELGRFSQRYRQHFGETPSATLARGAGRKVCKRRRSGTNWSGNYNKQAGLFEGARQPSRIPAPCSSRRPS